MTTNQALGPQQPPTLPLNDIHLPEQISNLPIAFGWWLLAIIIIISLLLFAKYYRQNKRLNAAKNHALQQLNTHKNINANESLNLLKWAVMQYANRADVAKLYGYNFQHFLVAQLPSKYHSQFIALSTPAFEVQYQPSDCANSNNQERIDKHCKAAVKLWLQNALPIKALNIINTTQLEENKP
ncbi:hypothetical protein GCM10009111_28640 [Colwellia asteriadis]|uniref:DUF4381 domain-containing protein n=1 Tax=Colwellia asteriadis TaxID=517723 RepID=A0ABN1L9R9_9GAMM